MNDNVVETSEDHALQVAVCTHLDGSTHLKHGALQFDLDYGEILCDVW